jgi:hypothetical protein
MEVKVCKNCRRLFKYIQGPALCMDCIRLLGPDASQDKRDKVGLLKPYILEDEKKLEQVKNYVLEHPKATVAEIVEAVDVSPVKLFDWIKGDRLEFSDDSEYAWFSCEKCGKKIKSGRYCNQCKPR